MGNEGVGKESEQQWLPPKCLVIYLNDCLFRGVGIHAKVTWQDNGDYSQEDYSHLTDNLCSSYQQTIVNFQEKTIAAFHWQVFFLSCQ